MGATTAQIRSWAMVVSASALVLPLAATLPEPSATAVRQQLASGRAPGAPGGPAVWTTGAKTGFGTARGTASKVWYTLGLGKATEIYYPRIDTPSLRDSQLVVSDGSTFTDREDADTTHVSRVIPGGGLTYRIVNTARSGDYRIVKTFVTDPARATVLVDVRFVSLTGDPYQVYVLTDPSLSMDGTDDTGGSAGSTLVASDATTGEAVATQPALTKLSTGYRGVSDGWTDLRYDHTMDWTYSAPRPGNIVQTGLTRLTGLPGHRHLTLAIGFGADRTAAERAAHASLGVGFTAVSRSYARGWAKYLRTLDPVPHSAARWQRQWRVSAMVLAASEDKTYRGGFVAAPSRPWAWAYELRDLPVYHAVWSRDLYEIATGLLADGDRAAAVRALHYLWTVQQRPDGSFPQNSRLDGTPVFDSLQMDEVAFPIVLDYQLGRFDDADWQHVKRSADFITRRGPATPEERWENIGHYSPATIAAEIAGLVCAADVARHNGASADAARYLRTADSWRRHLDHWTLTTNGPLSSKPYFLRVSLHGDANAATKIQISDGGPLIDQRRVVDPSFLELVRLGVLRADDPDIRNTISVVDRQLGYQTSIGEFWHRASFDGYGEKFDGSRWLPSAPGSAETHGRGWPLLTGERGEYQLADGFSAQAQLNTMAEATDPATDLMSEQVWDHRPPAAPGGRFAPGTSTFSARPLAWTHAQFLRLAASIDAGYPIETPQVVACRYHSELCRR